MPERRRECVGSFLTLLDYGLWAYADQGHLETVSCITVGIKEVKDENKEHDVRECRFSKHIIKEG